MPRHRSAQEEPLTLLQKLEQLKTLSAQITNLEQAKQLCTEFAGLNDDLLFSTLEIAQAYATALCEARDANSLFDFVQRFQNIFVLESAPVMVVAYAWALIQRGDVPTAHQLLEDLVQQPNLSSQTQCLAWQRLMLARYFVGNEDWREARDKYRQSPHDRNYGLGLLLEGFILHKKHAFGEAKNCCSNALVYFRNDAFQYARIHYNLGIIDLLECHDDCARHFEISRIESKKPGGQQFLTVALTGLGAAHCMRGAWRAAETAYARAIEEATEDRDYRQAYLNFARTYRLQNRPHEALEQLIFAASYLPDDLQEVQLERAAAHLLEHHLDLAKNELQNLNLGGTDAWLVQIVQAELERQLGNTSAMLEALQGVPMQSRLAREEARVFPELFASATANGLDTPKPLPTPKKIRIEVRVMGVLEVLADGHMVDDLDVVSLGAQVLVYLLEHQHSSTTEKMVNDIWFDLTTVQYKSKCRQVWQAVQRLNTFLPIDDAVQSGKNKTGVYRLSKDLEWHCDIHGFEGKVEAYLIGMHSHWIDKKRGKYGLIKS